MSSNLYAQKKQIVFIGASVGFDWKLEDFHNRKSIDSYKINFIGDYQFDKSESIKKALIQKPNLIIIKECAAFFPHDLEKYKEHISKWLKQCQQSQVPIVFASVIPITKKISVIDYCKYLLKKTIG